MLVDVNLIEMKERRRGGYIAFVTVIVICLLLWGQLLYYFEALNQKDSQLQSKMNQIEQVNTITAKSMDESKTSTAVKSLNAAVNWANNYPISTSLLLKNIANLLPEYGYIETFQLNPDYSLLLSIRFDTKKDAAYYLKHLEDAKFVEEVDFNSITAEDVQSENSDPPRYLAQYTLMLNKDSLKKEQDR